MRVPEPSISKAFRWLFAVCVSVCLLLTGEASAEKAPITLEAEWQSTIAPLLRTYCFECHSEEQIEADIDLAEFASPADIRKNVKAWIKVRQMLDTNQMPPKDSDQPSDDQSQQLRSWVNRFLTAEAESRAGDPGPVILRRLNNAEYDYTVQDLTGISSLSPTAEFPVDGAAGEGFTNTGSAQSMSPSLVSKYLDAAKSVAAHAIFLPDGLRFSKHTSRRDQSDELVAKIQAFYRRFSQDSDETAVNFDGVTYKSKQEGWLPIEGYLRATIEERSALNDRSTTIEQVAKKRGLNSRYLTKLWTVFTTSSPDKPSLLLDQLRLKWQRSNVNDVPALVAEIKQAQQILWKFNSIGQYGGEGTQKRWMEAVSPILTTQEFRVTLSNSKPDQPATVYLNAQSPPGNDHQSVAIWSQPRLEFAPDSTGYQHAPIHLRDLPQLVGRTQQLMLSELPRTSAYLAAAAKMKSAQSSVADLAAAESLNADLLARWLAVADLSTPGSRIVSGHFNTQINTSFGNDAIKGWGTASTPSLLTNPTDADVRFRTLTIPARSVTVHPSPVEDSIVVWRSPLTGGVRLTGQITDVDRNGGNGVNWSINLIQESGNVSLADGTLNNGDTADFSITTEIAVHEGDLISLVVDARDASHVCDTTHIELRLAEDGGEKRVWDLADDIVDRIHESNPMSDSYGNENTWHFASRKHKPQVKSPIPSGSTFALWRAAVLNDRPKAELQKLATAVQRAITKADGKSQKDSDQRLHSLLLDWKGPLRWTEVTSSSDAPVNTDYGIAPDQFGRHPSGLEIDTTSLATPVPQTTVITIPAQLSSGADFVTSSMLPEAASPETCLQLRVSTTSLNDVAISAAFPLMARPETEVWRRINAGMDAYRNLFPKALSYSRIVPVDEVVTMALYFREDDHLQRLMLNDDQVAELNRLWDELFYVAQEPIALTVVYEQIYEFATQDRQDLVEAFAPMRGPINARADVFRERLLQTQPEHLNAVCDFAGLAWRRRLLASEQESLRTLYQQLRDTEIPHENAIRLVIAKVLTSPAFLYRGEQPGPTEEAALVSSSEISNRLSYFLWSSLPDAELCRKADAGQLNNDAILMQQTRRMLSDEKVRRLAIHFACQWMHLRDFDQNDDKNEHLYPEFASIRKDMYEETVRFFADMFRNNGSILDVLNADHTFLNQALAQHYGIDNVTGANWRRVSNVRSQGRGGVLGMATLLASQSGASRTSPILRGNWVYETLLGERLPRPPANVPQLPEALPEGLTARQLIEQHTSVEACAKCHIRIDPYGFALEQYDAIGRLRPTPADTRTVLQNGAAMEGIEGLRQYLATDRRDDVVRQFCRKLLGFALGRETQLSDELLLTQMLKQLKANDYRFHTAVEAIVLSDQFRKIRGRKYVDSFAGR